MPEGQAIFSVMAGTVSGIPPNSAADRAGLGPFPAWRQLPRIVRYENHRKQPIDFSGEWSKDWGNEFSANNESVTEAEGAEMLFRFSGKSVEIVGSRGPHGGVAQVYLDGQEQGQFEAFSDSYATLQRLFKLDGLDESLHTLRIVNTGKSAAGSGGTRIGIDGFDVELH